MTVADRLVGASIGDKVALEFATRSAYDAPFVVRRVRGPTAWRAPLGADFRSARVELSRKRPSGRRFDAVVGADRVGLLDVGHDGRPQWVGRVVDAEPAGEVSLAARTQLVGAAQDDDDAGEPEPYRRAKAISTEGSA